MNKIGDQENNTRKYYVADIPDSDHLSKKTDSEGYRVALKFRNEDNSLNGPIRIKEVDPIDERRKIDLKIAQFQKENEEYEYKRRQQNHDNALETIQAVGELSDSLSQLIPELIRFGYWFKNTLYPTFKERTIPWVNKGISKLLKREQKNKDKTTVEKEYLGNAEITQSSPLTVYTPEQYIALTEEAYYHYRLNVSDEEAQRHFLNLVFGAAIVAQEIKFFSEKTVVHSNVKLDKEERRAWQVAFEEIATERVARSINTILQTNTSLLDEPAFLQAFQSIGGRISKEMVLEPIHQRDLQKALEINN